MRDKKIAEVCEAPWGSLCVKSDAYTESSASTFGWPGMTLGDRRTFHNESMAYIYNEGFRYLTPCYAYNLSDGEYTAVPGVARDVYDGTVADVDDGLCNCTNQWPLAVIIHETNAYS